MARRILRMVGAVPQVASEARFESEKVLQDAISAHPEVLPHEDLGRGPLVSLAVELDLGSGPMDLLAVDGKGRLAIVEFKKGSENPDVRKVVAQLLDYGSRLWRLTYDELESRIGASATSPTPLAERVSNQLTVLGQAPIDEAAFRSDVEACLTSGDFVFVYCGRDLDERTRRIMTYLAEGPRMTFFGVEVDYFRDNDGDHAVMVPRTAFVPTWITDPKPSDRSRPMPTRNLSSAGPEVQELARYMDELAAELGLQVSRRETGRNYLPPVLEQDVRYPNSGVGVYATARGAEFNLTKPARADARSASNPYGRWMSSPSG